MSTNHVKPAKPAMTVVEAEGLYRAPWITRKPRAIVTLAFDEHLDVLALTKPLMEAYADRVGAELVVIDGDFSPDWALGNKWRASSYAWLYDRTLFLDCDVLVMPSAPNIFEAEQAPFCARDERVDYKERPNWFQREAKALFDSQKVEHEIEHCPNGGVLLMTPESSAFYCEPPKPYIRTWCLDQHWLAYQLEANTVDVGWLDDRWNWGFIRHDWFTGLDKAWFVHLNGSRPMNYRIELARRVIAGDYSKFPPPFHPNWNPQFE